MPHESVFLRVLRLSWKSLAKNGNVGGLRYGSCYISDDDVRNSSGIKVGVGEK